MLPTPKTQKEIKMKLLDIKNTISGKWKKNTLKRINGQLNGSSKQKINKVIMALNERLGAKALVQGRVTMSKMIFRHIQGFPTQVKRNHILTCTWTDYTLGHRIARLSDSDCQTLGRERSVCFYEAGSHPSHDSSSLQRRISNFPCI